MQLFRETTDAEQKRQEVFWLALLFIVILASWLFVALFFGYYPGRRSYDENVLVFGLGACVVMVVLYLAVREREQGRKQRDLLARLAEAVRQRNDQVEVLGALCETSARLAGTPSPLRIAELTICALGQRLPGSELEITLVDPATGAPEMRQTAAWRGGRFIVEAMEREPSVSAAADSEAGDTICAPLCAETVACGHLVARRSEPEFTPGERRLLTTVANMAAQALEGARLHEELRESYFNTARTLARSLDARDNYTASHSERVTRLACAIAEQLGLPEGQVEEIQRFGPLHDLGKIGLRDDILLKPGPLTPEEWRLCQQHTAVGEQILRPLKPSPEALAMIRNHHESWDGNGYPDGLAGEETPLLARIVHVADAYDALSSERPFHSSVSELEALDTIRHQAGVVYDPGVVSALEEIVLADKPPTARPRVGALATSGDGS
jgi:GAF domain-containing protein